MFKLNCLSLLVMENSFERYSRVVYKSVCCQSYAKIWVKMTKIWVKNLFW